MLPVLLYTLSLFALAFAGYLLLTVLHELGHGLAALACTRETVTIYVGSYLQAEGSWHLRLGRLHLYLLRRPLRWWRAGCCQHQPARRSWQEALIVLAGPLLPMALSLVAFRLSLQGPNGGWRIAAFVFMLVAGISLLQNLFGGRGVRLADGRHWPNDGQLLRQHLRYPTRHRLPWQAHELVRAGHYAAAARCYEQLLHQRGPADAVFRVLLDCYWLAGRLEVALSVSQQFEQALPACFTDDDLFRRGSLLSHLNRHAPALALYEQLLAQPVPYANAYNNRGYTHSLLGQQEAALADFNCAIALGMEPAYAHANRGLAYLRQGRPADALADIAHALAVNPAEAYAFRNRGIYHLGRGEYAAALADFEQARQLNALTHGIEGYVRQAGQAVEAAGAA